MTSTVLVLMWFLALPATALVLLVLDSFLRFRQAKKSAPDETVVRPEETPNQVPVAAPAAPVAVPVGIERKFYARLEALAQRRGIRGGVLELLSHAIALVETNERQAAQGATLAFVDNDGKVVARVKGI